MIPDTRITYKGARVRLAGVQLLAEDNIRIIEAGYASMKERLSRGIGSDDAVAKALSKQYAELKTRRFGRAPIRDLRLTGALLDREIQVRYADDNGAIMDAASRLGRTKARVNRDMLQWSERDQAAMSEMAAQLFHDQVERNFSIGGRFGSPRAEFQRAGEFSR